MHRRLTHQKSLRNRTTYIKILIAIHSLIPLSHVVQRRLDSKSDNLGELRWLIKSETAINHSTNPRLCGVKTRLIVAPQSNAFGSLESKLHMLMQVNAGRFFSKSSPPRKFVFFPRWRLPPKCPPKSDTTCSILNILKRAKVEYRHIHTQTHTHTKPVYPLVRRWWTHHNNHSLVTYYTHLLKYDLQYLPVITITSQNDQHLLHLRIIIFMVE